MIALIDGDMAVYMAAAACQTTIDLDDGLGVTTIVDTENAIRSGLQMVEKWRKASGAKRAIVCFSVGDNFRKLVLPTYKANRTTPKPEAYSAIVEAVEQEYECWSIPGLEADDVMGIAATSGRGDFVIVSRDKDMGTIPALVFNPDYDAKPRRIRPTVADQMWMRQTMTGDPVDGYSGIAGMGSVGAQALMLDPRRLIKTSRPLTRGKNKGQLKTEWVKGPPCDLWTSMVDHAAKAGLTEAELITMARVARILRSGDFDTTRRVVRLWRPGGYEELQLND